MGLYGFYKSLHCWQPRKAVGFVVKPQNMSNKKTIPLDLFVSDFLLFCFEQDGRLSLMHQGGRDSEGSMIRAVFSNVLYDESMYLTLSDIADNLNIAQRAVVKVYHKNHNKRIHGVKGKTLPNKDYVKLNNTVRSLLDMYRAKKQAEFEHGDIGYGYKKYKCDTQAICSKTGEPIRYGDFIVGTTQGGKQFSKIPLPVVEIKKDTLGVRNHNILAPLKYDREMDDVVILEGVSLYHKSPLEWRYIL